ncbi:hypothetical protein FB45DRAFT_922904 [Roridomyces roridus]|uniref:Uncharacterized protein n=1 Tax=Roridomyces roridus TaxID=1738132 RepID=A0AAD7FL71_9AGAR|nr:hypothetical protein FB45DRAFT_922904 [Roridomyces roridus]
MPHDSLILCKGLPYELEREIFELAARAHPKFAPRLALVSSYVQTWVETVIYELIVLGASSSKPDLFWRTFSSRPASFFDKRIRTLHLGTGVSHTQARSLLAVCTNLTSLTCWSNPLPSGAKLRASLPHVLHRLSINAIALWGTGASLGPDVSDPLFARLTHLEIVNPPSWFDWSCLLVPGALPCLTHLAFGDLSFPHASSIIPFFSAALAASKEEEEGAPRLQMLVAVSRNAQFLAALEEFEELWEDKRLVCLPSYCHPWTPGEYWDGVARGEVQFWRSSPRVGGS